MTNISGMFFKQAVFIGHPVLPPIHNKCLVGKAVTSFSFSRY